MILDLIPFFFGDLRSFSGVFLGILDLPLFFPVILDLIPMFFSVTLDLIPVFFIGFRSSFCWILLMILLVTTFFPKVIEDDQCMHACACKNFSAVSTRVTNLWGPFIDCPPMAHRSPPIAHRWPLLPTAGHRKNCYGHRSGHLWNCGGSSHLDLSSHLDR